MNIYKLRADSNKFQNIILSNSNDYELLDNINSEKWKPIQAKLLSDNNGEKLMPGDFPSLMRSTPVLSSYAWQKLKKYLTPFCEALPIIVQNETYWLLNVHVTDILDIEHSRVERFSCSGRISSVLKFIPINESVPIIFKIPQTANSTVYVSAEFVELIKLYRLLGFEFELC